MFSYDRVCRPLRASLDVRTPDPLLFADPPRRTSGRLVFKIRSRCASAQPCPIRFYGVHYSAVNRPCCRRNQGDSFGGAVTLTYARRVPGTGDRGVRGPSDWQEGSRQGHRVPDTQRDVSPIKSVPYARRGI